MDEDELKNLARALREGPGREIREEAAADEEETERLRRRRLSLADAARGAMHRGDRITLRTAGLTLSHPVVSVGDDYVTLNDGERVADVSLEAASMTATPSREGGRSGRPASLTFRARLAELEQERAEVEMVTTDGDAVTGRLLTVAGDHVALAGPGETQSYLPVARVAVVFSRLPPRRG